MTFEPIADPSGTEQAARTLRQSRRPPPAANALAHLSHPVGSLRGAEAIQTQFLDPLARAFPDHEWRPILQLTGRFAGADWVATTGHVAGQFREPLWTIRPTGRPQFLPFASFDRIDSGVIAESLIILDLAALLLATAQWPLAPPLGQTILSPAPACGEGLQRAPPPAAESAASLALVEAMIAGLMRYDGISLASMGMRSFWTDHFHWYGPGGIGMARGHADYERAHQGPFLAAFPDRVGGDHRCRIGDGQFVASTGWPSIRATHSGGDWLGMPATGRKVSMRVMDFWRREADRLAENWVFIDIPHVAQQLGIDILARAAALRD